MLFRSRSDVGGGGWGGECYNQTHTFPFPNSGHQISNNAIALSGKSAEHFKPFLLHYIHFQRSSRGLIKCLADTKGECFFCCSENGLCRRRVQKQICRRPLESVAWAQVVRVSASSSNSSSSIEIQKPCHKEAAFNAQISVSRVYYNTPFPLAHLSQASAWGGGTVGVDFHWLFAVPSQNQTAVFAGLGRHLNL